VATAIVTGAASGIGRAVANRLAAGGAAIAVWDVQTSAARHVVAELRESGAEAEHIQVDVSDRADVARAVAEVRRLLPEPDVLVTCAGVSNSTPITELSTEQWRRVMSVNLDGVFFCVAEVAKAMIEAGTPGRIVTISSTAALSGFSKRAAYCASKTGVLGLTRAAALDLARRGIRINSIAPGSTLTPLTQPNAADPSMRELIDIVPMKRWAQAEEIAAAVAYLVGPDSSFVTGTVLPVDGGWSAGRVSLHEGVI
jgi:NAD(P)-dependent dehydrogenase (short-subunit alcohol dehydrogenase family)